MDPPVPRKARHFERVVLHVLKIEKQAGVQKRPSAMHMCRQRHLQRQLLAVKAGTACAGRFGQQFTICCQAMYTARLLKPLHSTSAQKASADVCTNEEVGVPKEPTGAAGLDIER